MSYRTKAVLSVVCIWSGIALAAYAAFGLLAGIAVALVGIGVAVKP